MYDVLCVSEHCSIRSNFYTGIFKFLIGSDKFQSLFYVIEFVDCIIKIYLSLNTGVACKGFVRLFLFFTCFLSFSFCFPEIFPFLFDISIEAVHICTRSYLDVGGCIWLAVFICFFCIIWLITFSRVKFFIIIGCRIVSTWFYTDRCHLYVVFINICQFLYSTRITVIFFGGVINLFFEVIHFLHNLVILVITMI